MPKTTGLFKRAEKLDEFSRRASGSISHYMTLNNVSEEQMAKKMNVLERTIQKRIKDPGAIRLRDLWEMAIIINCPVGEIAGGELPQELIGRWVADAQKKTE